VRMASCAIWAFAMMMMIGSTVMAFTASYTTTTTTTKPSNSKLFLSDWNDPENDNNSGGDQWKSSRQEVDWTVKMDGRNDENLWSSFESSNDNDDSELNGENNKQVEDADSDAWLDTLASLGAEEVQFNLKEADRADKARQMAEWGFDANTIANTLDIAMDDTLENTNEVEGMQSFRETAYLDDLLEDLKKVESHTKVEKDADTNEPVRQQMVYVDEHTCIGCTNCAMVAQSTFFMDEEHGRARVFQQWGDDEETIQIAIETCPVDCIHYVPYDELARLEVERRDQNINPKARLVSQAENGNSLSHRVGGANKFTAPQIISGNMGSRCNNCPSRGCKTCPMFGVGKNPEFERKEKERKSKIERRRLVQIREEDNKSADL
jgi:ferredoxin